MDCEMEESFFGLLERRVADVNSLLCVGLDPHIDELKAANAEELVNFSTNIIEKTIQHAAAFKINSAFFERFGAQGQSALNEVLSSIPRSIPVILDCKRGDIGSTAAVYADYFLGEAHAGDEFTSLNAHAVTVSAYMGKDSLFPFSKYAKKGVFILCKTSNPGSSDVQMLRLEGSEGAKHVYEEVALLASTQWNDNHNIGLVVGALDIEALRNVRSIVKDMWLLCPGIGFQGGSLVEACQAALYVKPCDNASTCMASKCLFTVSRGISQSLDVCGSACALKEAINQVRKEKELEVGYQEKPCAHQESEEESELLPCQQDFIQLALSAKALCFGSFELKSGRISPYFFNMGEINSGQSLNALSECYAETIVSHVERSSMKSLLEVDVVFGPAYKGISIACGVSMALSRDDKFNSIQQQIKHSHCTSHVPHEEYNVKFAYNRKESKSHGEGGCLVGASLQGQSVLIVDDVMSAGTAIRESIRIVQEVGGIVTGILVGLDRQEIGVESSALGAKKDIEIEFGIPVFSIITISDLSQYLSMRGDEKILREVESYRNTYCIA